MKWNFFDLPNNLYSIVYGLLWYWNAVVSRWMWSMVFDASMTKNYSKRKLRSDVLVQVNLYSGCCCERLYGLLLFLFLCITLFSTFKVNMKKENSQQSVIRLKGNITLAQSGRSCLTLKLNGIHLHIKHTLIHLNLHLVSYDLQHAVVYYLVWLSKTFPPFPPYSSVRSIEAFHMNSIYTYIFLI